MEIAVNFSQHDDVGVAPVEERLGFATDATACKTRQLYTTSIIAGSNPWQYTMRKGMIMVPTLSLERLRIRCWAPLVQCQPVSSRTGDVLNSDQNN